jgi:hypothetical protein
VNLDASADLAFTLVRNAHSGTKEKTMSTKRLSINITPIERGARIILGLVVVVAAALLLRDADSAVTFALEILLVLAGLDLVITGATGHCPLYKKLGHVPASVRGRTS